jgi:DNA-binding NarL/FixJ family response regulator
MTPHVKTSPVVVTVLSDDLLTASGVVMYLKAMPDARLVPLEEASNAGVVLVVTVTMSDELLAKMESLPVPAGRRCLVLVADSVSERHMARAFACGVVSIVPRRTASRDAIEHAVMTSEAGGAMLSPPTVRWLVDYNRDFAELMRSAHGITAGGLTLRETEVLTLLAEGRSTVEIATRLNYAERTIKNIIRELLERHKFSNRTQAVAYAIRVGAI